MSTLCPNGFPNIAMYKGITLADGVTPAPGAPFNPLFPPPAATSTSTAPTASTSTSVNAITASLISAGPVAIISSSTPSSSFAPSNETCIINVLSDDSDDEAENVDKILNRSMSLPPTFKVSNVSSLNVPFSVEHLIWHCAIENRSESFPSPFFNVKALIDDGSHLVLICPQLVDKLNLCIRPLLQPIEITVALDSAPTTLMKWVKLKLYDRQKAWSSRTVCAIIAPGLCSDIILGLPFLAANNLIVDAAERSVIDKLTGFNLLQTPSSSSVPTVPDPVHVRKQSAFLNVSTSKSLPFHALPSSETAFTVQSDPVYMKLRDADVVAAVRS